VHGDGAIVCFWWPLADHDHVSELAYVVRAPTRTPFDPSGAQASNQLATSFAAALHEQGLIDRLVTHVHHRIVGELHPQTGWRSAGATTILCSHCVTWDASQAQLSFGVLGRRARSRALWCTRRAR